MPNIRKKYSLRKYKVGLFSVLVGVGVGLGATNALASDSEVQASTVVATSTTPSSEASNSAEVATSPTSEVVTNVANEQATSSATPSEVATTKTTTSTSEQTTTSSTSEVTSSSQPSESAPTPSEVSSPASTVNSTTSIETKVNPFSGEKSPTTTNSETTPSKEATPLQSSTQSNKVQAGESSSTEEGTTTSPIPPQTNPNVVSEENSLINVQPLWDKGIKGQGRVVAILDTGLDINHNMFQLLDKSAARYKSEEELEAVKKQAGINYGKWYNDKVIFAYNYSDMNDEIKEFDTLSHGTHVSGSAVGNATEPAPTGDVIKGVAPEAQLIFMRLFSEKKGGTQQSFTLVQAVEDAIKLGADTINMSFGSPTGIIDDLDDQTRLVLEKARKAGVTIVTAGGNYATSGYWHAKPKAENPDYGTVNTPAVDPNVLAIAAYNASVNHKTSITLDVPQLKNNAEFNNGHSDVIPYVLTFNVKDNEDYVYLPDGDAASYNTSLVANKVVLVQSGGQISDNDKLVALRQAGAKGVLIYQTKEQGDTPTYLDLGGYESSYIPVGIIGNKLGEELALHAGEYKLNITNNVVKVPYDEAHRMLYFSGWGVSTEGDLKPDVAFPGGMIYSSVNNGLYYMNSGTSMATPHAAGSVALIRQVLESRFPNYSKEDLESLLQNLVMSTAKPAINPESNTYYSPRLQGAGLADVYNAAYGDIYLTTADKKPSITLGNVGDKFDFEVTVHNLSNKDKKLVYNTVVATDEIKDGRATLNSRQLANIEGEEVVVPANGVKTVKVKVDTSKYSSELSDLMKNGYFLEGFTFFKDATTNEEVVSAPFLGFKGTFQDLQGIEKPIYDFKDNEKPFYYYENDKAANPVKASGNYFTSLISSAYDANGNSNDVVLGENGDSYDGTKLYFSPSNNDGDYDTVKLNAVLLRNVSNIHLSVYAKDDVERKNPIFEAGNDSQRKSDYGWAQNARSAVIYATEWNGVDKDGKVVADGEYQYVITYRPSAAGAKVQTLNFTVKVDNTAPTLTKKDDLYNETTRVFNPGTIIEDGSGLSGEYLSYEDNGNTISVSQEADGTYILPSGIDLSTVRYSIWDNVHNRATLDINGNLIVTPPYTPAPTEEATEETTTEPTKKDTAGRIEVSFSDESGADYGYYPEIARYIVLDEAGNRVDVELNSHYESNIPTLPYGTYTIKVVNQDNKVSWLTSPEVKVTIDKDNPQKKVDFKFAYADNNRVDVIFNQEVPAGTRVVATDKDGNAFDLVLGKYNKQAFEKLLNNGTYTINITLPSGYVADKNNFDYEVTNSVHYININISKKEETTPSNGGTTPPSGEQTTPSNNGENNSQNGGNFSNGNNQNINKLPHNENTKPLYLDKNNNRIPNSKNNSNATKAKANALPKTATKTSTQTFGLAALVSAAMLAFRKRKNNN